VDHYSSNHASALSRWITQTFEPRGLQVKSRLRGNNLHLLCQAQLCPDRAAILFWLIPALRKTDPNTLLSDDDSPIYRVQIYGCQPGAGQPLWTAAIHLNQLDRHLQQIQQATQRSTLPEAASQSPDSPERHRADSQKSSVKATRFANRSVLRLQKNFAQGEIDQDRGNQDRANQHIDRENSALALSNRSLAQKGQEVAIASYLSEALTDLGVAVRVSAKTVPYLSPSTVQSGAIPLAAMTTKRLWIACGAANP
jgi:hypothetical protein